MRDPGRMDAGRSGHRLLAQIVLFPQLAYRTPEPELRFRASRHQGGRSRFGPVWSIDFNSSSFGWMKPATRCGREMTVQQTIASLDSCSDAVFVPAAADHPAVRWM